MKLSAAVLTGTLLGTALSPLVWSQEILTSVTTETYGLLGADKVVYLDYPASKATLYQVNLPDKTKKVLIPEAGGGPNSGYYFMYYGMSGNHLAYIPFSMQPTYPLNYLNLSTGTKKKLTADDGWKETVMVGGDIVVWVDFRHKTDGDKNSEIYLHDLKTGSEKRLTTSPTYQTKAFTDGVHAVWVDYAGGNKGVVVLHNIASGTQTNLGDGQFHQDNPRVSGDYVVWEDYRNATSDTANADIYAYNIKTKNTMEVVTAAGYQGNPFIHGDAVVWQDHRNVKGDGNADIYAYDLKGAKEIRVTNSPGFEGNPVVYGTQVVWMGIAGSAMNLYLGSLDFNTTLIRPTSMRTLKNGRNWNGERVRPDGKSVRLDNRLLPMGIYLPVGK